MKVNVLVAQLCLTLCDPKDCSPSGFSVHEILLEWVATPFSRGSSWPRDWTQVSRVAGGFFTTWATRKAHLTLLKVIYCDVCQYTTGIKSRGTPVSLFLSCIYLFIWLHRSQLQQTGYVSCGIPDLVPWTGIKPGPLHWELRVLATGPAEKSQLYSNFET